MILLCNGYLLQGDSCFLCRFTQHLFKIFYFHKTGTAAGDEIAASSQQHHSLFVNAFIAAVSMVYRSSGFCEGRGIQHNNVELSLFTGIQVFEHIRFHKRNPVFEMIQLCIGICLIQCSLRYIDSDNLTGISIRRI